MEAKIVTVPPTEPTYQLTLTLTKDELQRLVRVCGNVSGGGPTRRVLESIYNAGSEVVGSSCYYGARQIHTGIHLTGN